jgi:hypothetical protein
VAGAAESLDDDDDVWWNERWSTIAVLSGVSVKMVAGPEMMNSMQ